MGIWVHRNGACLTFCVNPLLHGVLARRARRDSGIMGELSLGGTCLVFPVCKAIRTSIELVVEADVA